MPIYPYSFQLPPLNVQDIPNDGAPGEFLGINGSGQLDWLTAGGGGSGDMLAANNLSELTNFATARTNIGLGTTNTPTFANLTLTSPSLVSSAPVTISQTWNGTGSTVFTGLRVNITNQVSAFTSNLLDIQLGGGSRFSIGRDGVVKINNGGTLTWNSADNLTISSTSAYQRVLAYSFYASGLGAGIGDTPGASGCTVFMGNDKGLGWLSGANIGVGAVDTILLRDGAPNTLALRNGAAAQRFNVYNTYLNAGADYERIGIGDIPAISGNVGLYYARSGSGAARGIYIWNDSNSSIVLSTNATNRWHILNTGHLHAWTDNTFDIGASGASRPRNVYVGTSLFVGSGTGTGVYHPTNGGVAFTGSGVVTVYGGSSYTTFDKFQIGGSTSAFPTLKRVGAELQVVIASTAAAINVAAGDADLTFIEDRYRRKGAGTPEGVVTAPIGAVYHNTTGGAGTSFYVKESGTGNTGWVGK